MSTPAVPSNASTPSRTHGRRGADTRERIEEAAGTLFTERGYHRATMQAIADAAGVHVQTVYLAYGTKQALLAASAIRLAATAMPDSTERATVGHGDHG